MKKRKIVPPVYLLLALLSAALLQHYAPIWQFVSPPLTYAGVVPVLAGTVMAAVSAGMFKKAETGIVPFDEATTLVTGGFYRVTRNPMYLGMLLMLAGVVFLFGSVGSALPVPLFFLLIRNRFVLAEERFLEAAFGRQYLEYCAKVRRWL